MAKGRPAAEVLPGRIDAKATEELFRRGRGCPPKTNRKVNETIRLDPDVLAAYQQTGRGWQTRINTGVAQAYAWSPEVKPAIDILRFAREHCAVRIDLSRL